ncbi:MAG: cell division protein FtsA [Beijerinckiaceae bacterium]
MSRSMSITPRMKRLAPNRSATLSVIDIGTNKIVCLVAELEPINSADAIRGRTHACRVLGIGHQRSAGMKAGVIVDMDAAERALRHAIDAAERMARVEIQSALVNLSGGRLNSVTHQGITPLRGQAVGAGEVDRSVHAAAQMLVQPGRVVMHALPVSYTLDNGNAVHDPVGMVGSELSCALHAVSSDATATRNLMLAVERCHVDVEAVVATPYASGLSCLIDDEADMGAIVIDMGAGTTTFGVFAHGRLVHTDGIAVGGYHVTLDVARGLSTRLSDAERIKTLFGSVITGSADDRDVIAVPQVDEGDRDVEAHLPRAHLTRIIKPRVEEILELVRDRLKNAGHAPDAGPRIIVTGGASQLTGLPDLARRVFGATVRMGKPHGVKGLPEAAKGPAFAASVGLLVYPQVAHLDRVDLRTVSMKATGTDGRFARLTRWLKDSF